MFKRVVLIIAVVLIICMPFTAYAQAKAAADPLTETLLQALIRSMIQALMGSAGAAPIGTMTTAQSNDFFDWVYKQLSAPVQTQIQLQIAGLVAITAAGDIVAKEVDGIGHLFVIDSTLQSAFRNEMINIFGVGDVINITTEQSGYFKSPDGVRLPFCNAPLLDNNVATGYYNIPGAIRCPSDGSNNFTIDLYMGNALDTGYPLRFKAMTYTSWGNLLAGLPLKTGFMAYFWNGNEVSSAGTPNLGYYDSTVGWAQDDYFFYICQTLPSGALHPAFYRHVRGSTYGWVCSQDISQVTIDYIHSLEAIDTTAPWGQVSVDADNVGMDTTPAIDEPATYPDGVSVDAPGTITIPIDLLNDILDELDQANTDTDNPPDVAVPPEVETWKTPAIIVNKFPFCIPYDIYLIFQGLNATKQVPVFTIPVKIPAIGIDTSFDLDLSQFEPLAVVARAISVMTAIIALALGTRKLIMS